MNRRNIQNQGFTLVEMLVVIALIALLIALLMPALQQARETMKSVVCLARQSQVGIMFGLYTSDYGGVIATRPGQPWSRVLIEQGYASNATYENHSDQKALQVFHCPTLEPDRYDSQRSFGAIRIRYADRKLRCLETVGEGGWLSKEQYLKLSQMDRPARFAILADTLKGDGPLQDAGKERSYFEPATFSFQAGVHCRHGGGANMLAADFHAETVPPSSMLSWNAHLPKDDRDNPVWRYYTLRGDAEMISP